MKNKKIYFIVGPSRSGSSLLEERLNSIDGITAFGELRWFFRRGFLDNEICGCRKRFHDCHFWKRFNESYTIQDAKVYDDLRVYFDKFINIIPIFFSAFRSSKWQENFNNYQTGLNKLYLGLFRDHKYIVDNSKSPFYFFLLDHSLGSKDVEIIPILYDRECISIVDSYAKDKVRKESISQELMTKKSFPHVLMYLLAIRLISKFIKVRRRDSVEIRYKHFCLNEKKILARITGLEINQFHIENYHSVSGNPDRIDGLGETLYRKRHKKGIFDIKYMISYFFDKITL